MSKKRKADEFDSKSVPSEEPILQAGIAPYGMSMLYFNGFNKDEKQGVFWLKKTIEQGAIAQYQLARCYESGTGVEKDLKEAFQLYKKSAEQKHSEAELKVGICLQKGIGTVTDLKEAVKWYVKASQNGNHEATNSLGECYRDGIGVPKDQVKARELFENTAELGNGNAMYNLYLCHKNGIGGSINLQKGLDCLKKAAEKDQCQAQFEWGCCCEDGVSGLLMMNRDEAGFWFEKAAIQDHIEAKVRLNELIKKNHYKLQSLNPQSLFGKTTHTNKKEEVSQLGCLIS